MNEWDEWKKRALEAQASKAPPIPTVGTEVPRRNLTESELGKLRRLCGVSVGGNNQAKSFILLFREATLQTPITERQAWYIQVLWYRYRRQLGVNPSKPEGYL